MFGHASQRGDTNRHENPVGPLRQDQLGLHGQACQEAASSGPHVRGEEGAQEMRRRAHPGRQRPAIQLLKSGRAHRPLGRESPHRAGPPGNHIGRSRTARYQGQRVGQQNLNFETMRFLYRCRYKHIR